MTTYPTKYCEITDKDVHIYKKFKNEKNIDNKSTREEIIDFLYGLREYDKRKIMGIEYTYIDKLIYDLENRL